MDLQSLPWYFQLLVFLLIGGLVIGIYWYMDYSPTSDQITQLDKQIEDVSAEIRKAEQKQDNMKQIQAQIQEKEKLLEDLREVLPEEKEISQILSKVQAIISSARLKMISWTTQPERRKEVYTEVPYSISVEGNYHNLAIFFDQLSRLKKIFTVDNVTIVPNTSNPGNSSFTVGASFSATTYTYRDSKKSSSAGKN